MEFSRLNKNSKLVKNLKNKPWWNKIINLTNNTSAKKTRISRITDII